LIGSVGLVFLMHELFELGFSVTEGLNSGNDLFFDIRVKIDFQDVGYKADQTNFFVIVFEESFETVIVGS
jgi:hypothetical protein